jgi:hypothetical protein
VVRLRANETSILAGMIESSEIRSITGWPGVAELPVVGPLTSDRNTQRADTELVIAITPRQLRLTPREGRTFYAGRGVGTAAPPEPAAPGQLPPGAVPGAAPGPAGINAPPIAVPAPGAPGGPPAPAPEIAPPNQAAGPNAGIAGNPQNPGANPQPNAPPPAGGTPPNPDR